MTPLAVLLASVLLQLAPPGRCARLYRSTEALRQRMIEELRAEGRPTANMLQKSAEQSRRARQCYGTHLSDTVATLYERELYALRHLHRYEKAVAVADSFLKRFRGSGRADQMSYVYQRRGRLHAARGKIELALGDYSQAVVYAHEAGLPAWRKAELYLDAANLHKRLYDLDAAHRYAEHAERTLRSASLAGRHNVSALARVLRYQADVRILQADMAGAGGNTRSLERAAKKALQSAQLYERSNILQGAGLAYVKAAEANAFAGRPTAALPHMREAMRLAEETGDLALRSAATYKMARLRLQRREYVRAERLFDRALDLAKRRGDLDYQRRISTDRGLLHEMRREWNEALHWYRRAAGFMERYQASLGATEWAAQISGNRFGQQPYRGQARVLLKQGKPRAAFRVLEQSRSRYLRTLRWRARFTKDLPRVQRTRLDSLRRALAATRDSLGRAPVDDPQRPTFRARAVHLTTALNDALNLPPDTSSFSVAATRQALTPRRRVLISYFLDEGSSIFERATTSRAFVLTADTLCAVALDAPADTVSALMQRISPVLDGTTPRSPGDVQFNLRYSHKLYQALLAPLASLVPDEAPLVIIPDGPLYSLPFGSLTTQTSPPFAYRSAPYLLRHHAVSTEGSATLLSSTAQDDGGARYDVVAFGKSTFNDDATASRSLFRKASDSLLQTGTLTDLPAVPRELGALRNLFEHVFVVQGEKATETAFYEHMSEGRILHLASHTVMHPTSPLYNAIVLSHGTAQREDGIIYLHELQRRSLDAPLVVLSGCNTARGPMRTGEGMAGLQYGFRAMGAKSLLATRWLIEDNATAQLMRDFYRHLRDGSPKDEALRQAQLEYLGKASSERTSPFFWAAPVLYGQTRALALEARRHRFAGKWTIGGLVFLAVLGLLWWRRRRAG